jgi:hypothetical protein
MDLCPIIPVHFDIGQCVGTVPPSGVQRLRTLFW